jgi:hypothetical protein
MCLLDVRFGATAEVELPRARRQRSWYVPLKAIPASVLWRDPLTAAPNCLAVSAAAPKDERNDPDRAAPIVTWIVLLPPAPSAIARLALIGPARRRLDSERQ